MATKKIQLELTHVKELLHDKFTIIEGQNFKRYRLIEDTSVDKTHNKLSREERDYSTAVTCSGSLYFFKEGDEKNIYLLIYSCSGDNLKDVEDVAFDSNDFTADLVPANEKKTIPKKDSIEINYYPKEEVKEVKKTIKKTAAKTGKSIPASELLQIQYLQKSMSENMRRDYFAGLAFQTILKMSLENKWRGSNEEVCEESYLWADLMLEARDKF